MRIKIQGFLGQMHSWAIVNQNIARALIKRGHDVELISTDGTKHLPEDLLSHLKPIPTGIYQCQISYTAPINWGAYLANGIKNRFGIWCWEFRGSLDKNNNRLPTYPEGFAKHYKSTDKILAPSNFSRDMFIENKVPPEHVVVVPHGINSKDFSSTEKFALQTKKKYKILANIAQPHLRKNLPGLFEAYGRAFTKKDDVCLVVKVFLNNKKDSTFDVDFQDIFNDFIKKYPNRATVEIVNKYIPNIADLYNSCDILFTMTHCEAFYMPGLEIFAANKLNIAPRYGGLLDFMNDNNSILIDGKEVQANRRMQYWSPNVQSVVFEPNVDDAAMKLRYAIDNYDSLMDKFLPNMKETASKFSWDIVANQILGLVE